MTKRVLFLFSLICLSLYSQNYRIGAEWSRVERKHFPKRLKRVSKPVGEIGYSATIFYIGSYKSKFYGITNAHVCMNNKKCKNRSIEFSYYKNEYGRSLRGKVKNVVHVNKSLDYSLIEIDFYNLVNPKRFKPLKLSNKIPTQGKALALIGFGANKNDYGLQTADISDHCKVFSKTNDIRKISDPDSSSPLSYKVLSFLVGCEASHGDSGAPILDRKTNEVIGLLWTGKVPKSPEILSDDFVDLPLNFLWKELTYASPAYLIKKDLKNKFELL